MNILINKYVYRKIVKRGKSWSTVLEYTLGLLQELYQAASWRIVVSATFIVYAVDAAIHMLLGIPVVIVMPKVIGFGLSFAVYYAAYKVLHAVMHGQINGGEFVTPKS